MRGGGAAISSLARSPAVAASALGMADWTVAGRHASSGAGVVDDQVEVSSSIECGKPHRLRYRSQVLPSSIAAKAKLPELSHDPSRTK
jgi:hypothetical protein